MSTPPASAPSPSTLGDRIRLRLVQLSMSQTALARKSGVDRSDINRIIKNHREPRLSELPLIAAAIGVDVDELIRDADVPTGFQREIERMNQSALRLMEAEAARDEAIARAEAVTRAFGEIGINYDRDRQRWADELEAQRTACEGRVSDYHREKVALEAQFSKVRRQNAALQGKVAELEATVATLRAEAATLREQLSGEQSSKVLTGVLSGLAGFAAGAATSRRPAAGQDDEVG